MECRDGAVQGKQGTSAGEETDDDGGGGSDERVRRGGPARGKWGGAKEAERRKKARGKKAKEGGVAPEGRSGGDWEMSPVSGSPSTLVWGWVSVHFVFLHTV